MHHVGRLADLAAVNGLYEARSVAHARFPMVDRTTGSVHQELRVAELGSGGRVELHRHAHEEGLYVLAGEMTLTVAGSEEQLSAHDVVFIDVGVAHALQNQSSAAARWLELGAPQSGTDLEDPAFHASGPETGATENEYRRGRFEESELPAPSGALGLAGFGEANVGGAALKMLIDKDAGASQFNLFVVQYQPGGFIREHDHPFEEAFFFVSGEIEAVLDGETYILHAGDFCWSGSGSMHTFTNRSNEPVRWIETQVPQPPGRYQARFRSEWERLLSGGGA